MCVIPCPFEKAFFPPKCLFDGGISTVLKHSDRVWDPVFIKDFPISSAVAEGCFYSNSNSNSNSISTSNDIDNGNSKKSNSNDNNQLLCKCTTYIISPIAYNVAVSKGLFLSAL